MVYNQGTGTGEAMDRKRIQLPPTSELQLWVRWSGRGRHQRGLDWRLPSTDRFTLPWLGPTSTLFMRHVVVPAIAETPAGYIRLDLAASLLGVRADKIRGCIKRLIDYQLCEATVEGDHVDLQFHPWVQVRVSANRRRELGPTWVDALNTEIERQEEALALREEAFKRSMEDYMPTNAARLARGEELL